MSSAATEMLQGELTGDQKTCQTALPRFRLGHPEPYLCEDPVLRYTNVKAPQKRRLVVRQSDISDLLSDWKMRKNTAYVFCMTTETPLETCKEKTLSEFVKSSMTFNKYN